MKQGKLLSSAVDQSGPVVGLDAPPELGADLRLAVVHDTLTGRGAGELAVLTLMQAFPEARLVTTAFTPEETFGEFARYTVEIAGPELVGVDIVLCTATGWPREVRTGAVTLVVDPYLNGTDDGLLRQTLLHEAELALVGRGLDPVRPLAPAALRPAPMPALPLRRALTLSIVALLLLAVLTGTASTRLNPMLHALTGLFLVGAVVLTRLRWDLREHREHRARAPHA